MVVTVWLAVPCSPSIQGRDFELVPLGQVFVFSWSWIIYLHWVIRSGQINATIWQIEELPCSCFWIFWYRSGPTDSDLFSIAWPSCYRIQECCTNGHFFSIGVFNSTRMTAAWEDNFMKVNPAYLIGIQRVQQHWLQLHQVLLRHHSLCTGKSSVAQAERQ